MVTSLHVHPGVALRINGVHYTGPRTGGKRFFVVRGGRAASMSTPLCSTGAIIQVPHGLATTFGGHYR